MANNCHGISFTAYCPDGSEHTGDAGDYFAGLGMAYTGGAVNQADIAGGGQCSSLAAEHYESYTCMPLASLGHSSSQIVQKRRIPPLGPKSRMRSATGLSEKQVGGTMALYAYLGTALGTYAAMQYLGVLNKSTHKIGIAGAMIFAGLALGSKIGAIRVEQKRGK